MRFLPVFIIIVLAFFLLFRFETVAVLIVEKNGSAIYSKTITDNRFVLTYVHSVEKTPVYEYYEVLKDNLLHLYKTRYMSLGTGLPSQAEGRFLIKDGVFEMEISRTFKRISLRVSPIYGQGIIFNDGKVMFSDIAQTNDSLDIYSKLSLSVKPRFK